MISRVLRHAGFWKSVVVLTLAYMVILMILQWGLRGFSGVYFSGLLASGRWWVVPLAGFVAAFFVSYGKFWARIKRNDP